MSPTPLTGGFQLTELLYDKQSSAKHAGIGKNAVISNAMGVRWAGRPDYGIS